MGIFGGQNRVKSQSTTTTLVAEGCVINGHIKVENRLQVDGHVEGHIEAKDQLKISESGSVLGEITTERLIINGSYEGTCHATYIEILSCGRVCGTIYTDNLSIESGGKFMGVTHPSEKQPIKLDSHDELNSLETLDSDAPDNLDGLTTLEELDGKVTSINNEPNQYKV
ncbi:polymer-forming cytoskeletal family protein [Marinomonas sp. CT5]|uniref:bactofilin family protein n=1 Tax=Marinomonas sp. CT5 TaxID=2066133 RepID=UPI001BB021B3|nr:polymer-forming cytoskeletal protein [Marinomonas sp. CT5]QUX95577.1 polymer-forming cytoskeletal family protein [Marinomonas sp. CT5]